MTFIKLLLLSLVSFSAFASFEPQRLECVEKKSGEPVAVIIKNDKKQGYDLFLANRNGGLVLQNSLEQSQPSNTHFSLEETSGINGDWLMINLKKMEGNLVVVSGDSELLFMIKCTSK